jgi:hypothetical protein
LFDWRLKDIHRIRGLVQGICDWKAQAVAEQAAREKTEGVALAAAYRAGLEAKAARAAVMSRAVEEFETVTVVAGPNKTASAVIVLTAEKREALRQVVKEMRQHIFTLKEDVKEYNRVKLALIESVERYQESCCGDNTWIWNAEAWGAASSDLTSCRDYWRGFAKKNAIHTDDKRLWGECDACIDDMARYKELCGGGGKQSWVVAGLKRMVGLTAKLDTLKELAED